MEALLELLSVLDAEPMQWRMLRVLVRNGPQTPTQLTQSLGQFPSQISRTVNQLDDAEMVARTINGVDKRVIDVTITAKGRNALAVFNAERAVWVRERLKLVDYDTLQEVSIVLIEWNHNV